MTPVVTTDPNAPSRNVVIDEPGNGQPWDAGFLGDAYDDDETRSEVAGECA